MDWGRHYNLITEWELVYVHVNCVRAQHRLIWAEQSLGNLFPAPAARGVRPMALVTRGMPERWIFSSEGLLLSTWKNFSSSPLMNGLQPWCNQIHLKMAQDDELKILLQSNLSILMTHTHFSSLSSLVSWRYDENMSVRRDNPCSQDSFRYVMAARDSPRNGSCQSAISKWPGDISPDWRDEERLLRIVSLGCWHL